MTRQVVFAPEARDDLRRLYLYIAERSGDARAFAYLQRIEAFCLGLAEFAHRGRGRDEVWPNLRTVSLERRVTIAFTISPDTITILRVLYGGRDLDAAFNKE